MPFSCNHCTHSSPLAHNRLYSPITNLEKTGPEYSFLCIYRSYRSFWKYITNTAQCNNGTDGFQSLMVVTSLIQSRTTFAFSLPYHILLQQVSTFLYKLLQGQMVQTEIINKESLFMSIICLFFTYDSPVLSILSLFQIFS